MKIAQEYEKKFQSSISQSDFEDALGIVFEQGKRQVDVYYDTADAKLFLRGVFLRIRDSKYFQIKVNLDDLAAGRSSGHTRCTEVEAPLLFGQLERDALAPILEAVGLHLNAATSCYELFETNGLAPSVTIDKTRATSRQSWGTMYFDTVAELGQFLEVEAADAELFDAGMSATFRKMDGLLKQGVLKEIDTGYNALFWRQQDFGTYLRCPYVMRSDLPHLAV